MEIGGLLSGNARHTTNAEAQLRHHMQQGMTLDNHYAMTHNGGINSSINHYGMGQPVDYMQTNHALRPQIVPNTRMSPGSGNNTGLDVEASSPKPKAEAAAKSFACSSCSKAFARKSDLARHGRSNTSLNSIPANNWSRTYSHWR